MLLKHQVKRPWYAVPEIISLAAKYLTACQTYENWGTFAQEWRNSYLSFTRSIAADPSITYKTVDEHHLDSLRELLTTHNLSNLWPDDKIKDLSLIWHRLAPWPDTNAGLNALNKAGYTTVTLTNGNLELINNMVSNASMPFTHVFSAEMFNSYKPNPAIYLGAAKKLDLKPEECAMVAAHLDDLVGARKCGLRTVYVERKLEERHPELRDRKGLVDFWVEEEEEGFVRAAEMLGGS
jgi:2-haloacid dehalogenase